MGNSQNKIVEIEDQYKVDILLNLLNERYNASHLMRGRSMKFMLWVIGFVVISIGWLFINGNSLTTNQKVILTIFIAIIGAITIFFLLAIETGFNNNREVMIDIEEVLGCYEDNIYIKSKSLYPQEYKDKNKKSSWSHFKTIYFLIALALIMSVITLWYGYEENETKNQNTSQIEDNKTIKVDSKKGIPNSEIIITQ